MARPVGADAGATRERILGAAAHLFATMGLGRASMRGIARKAEVSQSTVHHYFHTKQALHQACIDEMYARLAQLREVLAPSWDATASPQQRLRNAVSQIYGFGRENSDAVRLVQRSVLDRGEGVHAERQAVLFGALDLLAAPLSEQSPHDDAEVRRVLYAFNLLMARMVLVGDEEIVRVHGGHEQAANHLGDLLLRWLSIEESGGT